MSGSPITLTPNNPVTMLACAVCGATFERAAGHRISVTPSMIPGLGSFNCPQGEHICCSLDHAAQAAHVCLTQHILPEVARRQAATGGPHA